MRAIPLWLLLSVGCDEEVDVGRPRLLDAAPRPDAAPDAPGRPDGASAPDAPRADAAPIPPVGALKPRGCTAAPGAR